MDPFGVLDHASKHESTEIDRTGVPVPNPGHLLLLAGRDAVTLYAIPRNPEIEICGTKRKAKIGVHYPSLTTRTPPHYIVSRICDVQHNHNPERDVHTLGHRPVDHDLHAPHLLLQHALPDDLKRDCASAAGANRVLPAWVLGCLRHLQRVAGLLFPRRVPKWLLPCDTGIRLVAARG